MNRTVPSLTPALPLEPATALGLIAGEALAEGSLGLTGDFVEARSLAPLVALMPFVVIFCGGFALFV